MSGDTSETIVFPQLSALNWPSYLLEAWRTLDTLGVPEQNIRFVPEIGHFAVPEISEQEPPGPVYDALGERLIVHRVDPAEVRPRLTVSVRADELDYFRRNPLTGLDERKTRTVGRLAHFLPPLTAGLPGAYPADLSLPPMEALTAQVSAAYPELSAVLLEDIRSDLEIGIGAALTTLTSEDPEAQAAVVQRYAVQIADPEVRAARHAAWLAMSDKLPTREIEGISEADLPAASAVFRQWADALYGPNPEAAPPYPFWTEFSLEDFLRQRLLLREMEIVLSYETRWGREKLIRELLEIMTTEAFTATAVLDSLHGIGWVHGRIADMAAGLVDLDGWFLSITGGRNSRSLLQSKLAEWASSDNGIFGVGEADLSVLDEMEQAQLWTLVAWRRETADPIMLLETALQRLIHPESSVQWTRYAPAPSRPGTLLAQPGSTAVLGGAALLLYPGVKIQMPVDDNGEEGERARAVLPLLLRLFLPVSCRIEVIWRQSAARLDQPTYLQHEFQAGAMLSGTQAVAENESPLSDPITL
ncbi:MAG: hypothetical protein ACRYFS_01545 [Janthinobacterium lividum]